MCFLNTAVEEASIPEGKRASLDQFGVGYGKENSWVVPQTTKIITSGQVNKCAELVVIPNSVEEISGYAFSQCEKLKKVFFESGSKLKKLGNNCFSNSGLEEIAIPYSVREIGDSAFKDCKRLSSVVLNEGL